LPALLIAACRASQRPFFVLALEGQADSPAIGAAPHAWVRLGAAAECERLLRSERIEDVVFAGKVRRPSLRELRPDWRAGRLMLRAAVRAWGDDGLMRAIVREVEREGVRVVPIQSILSDLLAPAGCLGRVRPDRQAQLDIRRGIQIVRGLGALDIGQAVIVQQGIVLGVEAAEGTDGLIDRCARLHREGAGGVLVKMRKPPQDHRVDLPTIGPGTVAAARRGGLRGIAVEAGATLVIDRDAVSRAADEGGLFVCGVQDREP
jgi:DUF1009 family protein